MISFDVISKVDAFVTVGIIVGHKVFGDIDNIGTVPFSFTTGWDFTIVTIEHSITWTGSFSPFIFGNNDTFSDFTVFEGSIEIEVTGFSNGSVVIVINVIFWVDITITVGIIISKDFPSILVNIGTGHFSLTVHTWFEWVVTIDMTISFWAVVISPFIFTNNDTFI